MLSILKQYFETSQQFYILHFQIKTILALMNFVTGATGLVGMRIMFDLLSKGEQVVALKRPTSDLTLVKRAFNFYSPDESGLFSKIIWKEGDVRDVYSISEAMEGCKKVYHTAAMVSFHRKDKAIMHQINVGGTANVVNCALEQKIDKMCYISSTAAVGRSTPGEEIDETNEWKESPLNSSYAKSKYDSEMEIWRGIEEGLNAVIVNPSVIIGPGDKGRSSSSLFSRSIPFYPKGINGYVSVNDVSKICLELMESSIISERYIISAENLNYKTLFTLVAQSLGKKPPRSEAKIWMIKAGWLADGLIEILTGKKAGVTKETIRSAGNTVYYNSSKIRKTLDYTFEPLTEVILRTGKFYK